MNKYLILGTSELTQVCLKTLIDNNEKLVGVISMPREMAPNNSIDLSYIAKEYNINYFETVNINSIETYNFIKSVNPDIIISTWPKIIERKIIDSVKIVIGTHPTPLPFNRGRHPLHWMISLGIKSSSLSFFKMNEGIDSGNVLLQVPFNIGDATISEALDSMNNAMVNGIKNLIEILKYNPSYSGYSQSSIEANYWRARNEHDITLDPRMSISILARIIRSFAKPFPEAMLFYNKGLYIRISDYRIIDHTNYPKNWQNFEHGQIVELRKDVLTLRVDDGLLDLYSNEIGKLEGLKRLFPPSYYF